MTREKIQEWLPKVWENDKRGLLTQRLAACLIGISDQAVRKAGDRGNIEYYECENVRLYSYTDALLYKKTREALIEKAKAFENDEKLKKENPQQWADMKEKQESEELQYIAESQRDIEQTQEQLDYLETEDKRLYDELVDREQEHAQNQKKQESMSKDLIKELNLIITNEGLKPKTKEAEEELQNHLKKFNMTESEFFDIINIL